VTALLAPFQLVQAAPAWRRLRGPTVVGTALVALLGLRAGPASDEGMLVIRQDTVEVAREAFRLSPRAGAGQTGWTLASTVRFESGRPTIVLHPILEIGPDSLPLSLEYNVADPREPLRILGQLARGRFTVRLLGRRTERVREYPGTPPLVVLDDSVLALYLAAAWQARPEPRQVNAVFPRSGRRELLAVEDRGVQATTLNRARQSLRHVTVTGGANGLVHLWLAPDGRLFKVEIPSRRATAERLPPL